MKSPLIDRQVATKTDGQPSQAELEAWTAEVLARHPEETCHEITVRFVDSEESRRLNRDYRGKDNPTNVLSFPFEAPPAVALPLLGDLVICHPVVVQEAAEQDKPLVEHYAHLVIHGTLHLLGHDHLEENEAEAMEALERDILAALGIADPYAPRRTVRIAPSKRHSDSEDERLDS